MTKRYSQIIRLINSYIGRIFTKRSDFFNNVLTLVSGTVIAQAIPVLISPILTRIFTPDDFGVFGLYLSIVLVLNVIATGRYEFSILLPEKDEDALHLLILTFLITLTITGTLFILILPFHQRFAEILKNPNISEWLIFVPITILFMGIFQPLILWHNRVKQYQKISKSRVLRSGTLSIFSILIGLIGLKPGGLILGDLCGQGFGSIYLLKNAFGKLKRYFKEMNLKKIGKMAIRYQNFPKFLMISGLFEKSSAQIPILLLTNFFGGIMAGFFTLAQRVIIVPTGIISGSIGEVFRQEASNLFVREGNCKSLFINTLRKLVAISFVPFLISFFIMVDLFEVLFGSDWRIAGEFSKIMIPMFFLQFITSPLSSMFIVAEKQKIDFTIQIVLFFTVLTAFLVSNEIFPGKPHSSILLFTIIYSLKYIVELILSYHFSKGINK